MQEQKHDDSTTVTRGINIHVEPRYNPKESNPTANVYLYSYTITIKNDGKDVVQLMSRHWIITDGFNEVRHVRGPGVVGEQPVLNPGESFTYTSFCPLPTPTGTMKGSFQMRGSDSKNFDAEIQEFKLFHQTLVN